MAVVANNYCLQQGITDFTKYGSIVFSGIQYAVLPAIVRSNPKQQELLTGLRQSDIQRLYDQKEGISLDMPSMSQPISLWWRHLNAHTERYPIIVWGNFDFGHRNFNILFRDRRDKKRNQHVFALTKKEIETDVGSTYALIKLMSDCFGS
jgi:hypothetical protein